jgi:hypothetical protein
MCTFHSSSDFKNLILENFKIAFQNKEKIDFLIVNMNQLQHIKKEFSDLFYSETNEIQLIRNRHGILFDATVIVEPAITEPAFLIIDKQSQKLKKMTLPVKKREPTNKFKFIGR